MILGSAHIQCSTLFKKKRLGHYLWAGLIQVRCFIQVRKLLPPRRGRACAGPNTMSQPLLKKYVEHYLWAGTRPAPAVVGLGKRLIVIMRNLINFIQACGLGKKLIVIMRPLNNFIQVVGLGKKLIVIMLSSKNFSCLRTWQESNCQFVELE